MEMNKVVISTVIFCVNSSRGCLENHLSRVCSSNPILTMPLTQMNIVLLLCNCEIYLSQLHSSKFGVRVQYTLLVILSRLTPC